MAKVGHIERHCETTEPNATCPYHSFGCYGCGTPGPWTDERREREREENKVLGLLVDADGIDRMAFRAGRTREEQIAHLDPVARSVERLVAKGGDREAAERFVISLVEQVGIHALGRYIDAACKLILDYRTRADELIMLGESPARPLEPKVTDYSGDTWSFISPFVSAGGNDLSMLPVKGKSVRPRGRGKRAQRRMGKPWAQNGIRP